MFFTRYLLIKAQQPITNKFGPFVRSVGQGLINAGIKFQGEAYQGDRSKIYMIIFSCSIIKMRPTWKVFS